MEDLTEQHIDQDAICDLLRAIEQRADQIGWHPDGEGHFTVYLIYDRADVVTAGRIERVMQRMGEPVLGERYAAQPMLPPDLFDRAGEAGNFDSPAEAFLNFGMNTAFADLEAAGDAGMKPERIDAIRVLIQQPGVLGFAAGNEAWGILHPSPMARALVDSGMPIDHIQGSRETRMVTAADITGRVYQIRRWKGDDPGDPETDVKRCDSITLGVRFLADVASGITLPKTQEEFDARYHDHD